MVSFEHIRALHIGIGFLVVGDDVVGFQKALVRIVVIFQYRVEVGLDLFTSLLCRHLGQATRKGRDRAGPISSPCRFLGCRDTAKPASNQQAAFDFSPYATTNHRTCLP